MKICRRSGLLVRHAASSDAKLVTASLAFPDEQARSATVRRVIASGPVPSPALRKRTDRSFNTQSMQHDHAEPSCSPALPANDAGLRERMPT